MTSIDFRIMAEAASGLERQAQYAALVQKQLSDLIEETMRAQARGEDPAGSRVPAGDAGSMRGQVRSEGISGINGISGISETSRDRGSFQERSGSFLARLREAALSLEMETRSLERASEALQEILRLYSRAQERAADIMNGEIPVIPRTEFGTSYFGNLEPYQSLIPVVRRIPMRDKSPGRTGAGQTEAGNSLLEAQGTSNLGGIL